MMFFTAIYYKQNIFVMGEKINSAQIEALIRAKVKEKGLSNDIDDTKISEIREKIKTNLGKPKNNKSDDNLTLWFSGDPRSNQSLKEEVPPVGATNQTVTPAQTPETAPEAIAQTVTVSKDAVELAKKEGELEQREKELAQKEIALSNKESELNQKEEELSYKPQVPAVLEGIGNESLFVFSEDEISLGAEALSSVKLRLLSNPDDKKSMIELWATEGKKAADLYLVKFEKIGEISFNPFEGTANFEKKPFNDGENPPSVPAQGLTPQEAQESQEPTEPMIDSVEPKSDVTLAPSNDMGLGSIDLERIIKSRVDDILKDYFLEKYPKL